MFAVLPVIPSCACALVAVDGSRTRGAVVTQRRKNGGGARVYFPFAELAGKPASARALETVDEILAATTVGAWMIEALVHVLLAERTDEPGDAPALEVVYPVPAEALVKARIDGALVEVVLTTVATVTGRTHAPEAVQLVDATSAV